MNGVIVHRPRSLRTADVVVHRGLSVTTIERTVLDLLPTLTEERVSRLLEGWVTHHRRSPDDIHAWVRELPPMRHRRKLLRAADRVVGPAILRSELEREFRDLCQRFDLPLAETNTQLGPWELDVFWRALGVEVELDSWRHHGGYWSFQRDRRKDLDLNRRGLRVIRLTWYQVKHEPASVAEALRDILGRARAHSGSAGS